MIIPQFWAEARRQHRERGKQVTVRRFGWSDSSEAAARMHADQRAEEALRRAVAGEPLPERERKHPYNGAEGVPIREEIVSRHGEVIVTRNSYGARCLNTPGVFFADLDHPQAPPPRLFLAACALPLLGALAAGLARHSFLLGLLAAVPALLLGFAVAGWLHRLAERARGGAEKIALRRVSVFAAGHPDWGLRVYRTPAGLRVLATHRRFDPGEPEVAEAFEALGTDPVYVQMCLRQQCFRARVSPKPWRIGIGEHIRPRGVWPVPPDRLPARDAWIERYEAKAKAFAACELLAEFGGGVVDPSVQPLLDLHDALCRATAGLPLA